MRVELVCIGPAGAIARDFLIEAPATVGDVLGRAATDPAFADARLATAVVGVFGRIVGRQQPVADGDRIEIYRGPAVDPKQARRARAGRRGPPG